MTSTLKEDNTQISKQNISYYNEIAADYDAILDKDAANKIIRKKVTDQFTALVEKGFVLDFGGGTGQDLEWLLLQGYNVIFCEPSAAMRQMAVERSKNKFPDANVNFLDDTEANFKNWPATFPPGHKVDAILANFAVINCIPDIELLFNNLALIIKRGGIVISLVLDYSLQKKLQSNLKGTIKSFFFREPVSFLIEYKGHHQKVYLHSMKAIKRATADSFQFDHLEQLQGSGFTLIHLTRK